MNFRKEGRKKYALYDGKYKVGAISKIGRSWHVPGACGKYSLEEAKSVLIKYWLQTYTKKYEDFDPKKVEK